MNATCVVIGETGILIRGEPGAGKSSLGRALLREAERDGRFAAFVADDRVVLTSEHGRLVATSPTSIAGLMEVRHLGIVPVGCEPACLVGLVVDLDPAAERIPEKPDATMIVLDVDVRRIAAPSVPAAADAVMWQLRGRDDTPMT